LKGTVYGWDLVGDVLPGVPDRIQPGAGEDPGGVWMVFAASDCLVIQPGRPWVGPTGVGGEVADRIAQLLVDRPAKADALVLAGLAGRGRDPGQAGQRARIGEAGAAVADLGQEPGG